MPLIKVHYPTELKPDTLHSLSSSLTELTAEALGKSSDFVMTVFQKTELQSFGLDINSPSLLLVISYRWSLRLSKCQLGISWECFLNTPSAFSPYCVFISKRFVFLVIAILSILNLSTLQMLMA